MDTKIHAETIKLSGYQKSLLEIAYLNNISVEELENREHGSHSGGVIADPPARQMNTEVRYADMAHSVAFRATPGEQVVSHDEVHHDVIYDVTRPYTSEYLEDLEREGKALKKQGEKLLRKMKMTDIAMYVAFGAMILALLAGVYVGRSELVVRHDKVTTERGNTDERQENTQVHTTND